MSKLYVGMAFCCLGFKCTDPPKPPAFMVETPHPSLNFSFTPDRPGSSPISIPKEHLDAKIGLMFVIGLHSDGITGRRTVKVVPPDIADGEIATFDVDFQDGKSSLNATNIEVMLRTSGTHWFEVRVDDEVLSRIPVGIQLPHD